MQDPTQAASPTPTASKCPFAAMLGGGAVEVPAPSLADALKAETTQAHARAEKHPLQATMIGGTITREGYAAWLGQMLHVWRAVDAGLATVARRDPRVAAMLQPYHPHADRIVADLAFLGQPATAPALPETAEFVRAINAAAASRGPDLVGIWYVLEGSANGGRFIARALSPALKIPGPEGLTSFDPHGDQQRPRWQAWRAALDAQPFSPAERAAIIDHASAGFNGIFNLMQGLARAASPRDVAAAS